MDRYLFRSNRIILAWMTRHHGRCRGHALLCTRSSQLGSARYSTDFTNRSNKICGFSHAIAAREFTTSSTSSGFNNTEDNFEYLKNRVEQFLDEGLVEDAQATLDAAIPRNKGGKESSGSSAIVIELQSNLLDGWLEHQQNLLDKYYNSFPFGEENTTTVSLTDEQKILLQDIYRAAENAHNLLEQIEPYLGVRNVWLDTKESIDKDGNDVDYRGTTSTLDADSVSVTTNHPSLSDHSDTKYMCQNVLMAWARAVRASNRGRNTSRSNNNNNTIRAVPQRAQFLLERMETYHMQPTINDYNRVLESWAYSNEHLRAVSAQRIFDRIPKQIRTGETYRLMIWAWALSHEQRAAFSATGFLMKLLRKMEKGEEHFLGTDMEPTLDDYQIVLQAWTRSEEKASPNKALSILQIMEDSFRRGLTMIQPDETCYQFVLQTAAKRPHLMQLGPLVDTVLSKMKDDNFMVPNAQCYTAAIRTWKNAAVHQPDVALRVREASVRRAVELLAEMEIAHQQTTTIDIKVSTSNINDVLEALTVSRQDKRLDLAERLLSKMEEALLAEDETMIPSAESYVHILRIWSTVPTMEKIAKGKMVLLRLQDKFSALSKYYKKKSRFIDVLNEFIGLCGSYHTRTDKEGIEVLKEALRAVEAMRKLDNLEPNSATYAALLDACKVLLPNGKDRSNLVEKVFKYCCDDGMVNDAVLAELKKATSPEQYSSLIISPSETFGGMRVIPEAWSARALGGKVISVDGRSIKPLSVEGKLTKTISMQEFQMRKLRSGKNRKLLQGGRLKPQQRDSLSSHPWRLYDN